MNKAQVEALAASVQKGAYNNAIREDVVSALGQYVQALGTRDNWVTGALALSTSELQSARQRIDKLEQERDAMQVSLDNAQAANVQLVPAEPEASAEPAADEIEETEG